MFIIKQPITLRNEIQELMIQNGGIIRERRTPKWIEKNFRIKEGVLF